VVDGCYCFVLGSACCVCKGTATTGGEGMGTALLLMLLTELGQGCAATAQLSIPSSLHGLAGRQVLCISQVCFCCWLRVLSRWKQSRLLLY
jgi:hypothetical protein